MSPSARSARDNDAEANIKIQSLRYLYSLDVPACDQREHFVVKWTHLIERLSIKINELKRPGPRTGRVTRDFLASIAYPGQTTEPESKRDELF